MTKVTIVGLAGRVGKDSDNTAILKAALELLPENTELDIIDEEGIGQQEPDAQKWGAHNAIVFDDENISTSEKNGRIENSADANAESTGDMPPFSVDSAAGQRDFRKPRVILNLRQIDKPGRAAGLALEKSAAR